LFNAPWRKIPKKAGFPVMAVAKVQPGQVWCQEETEENWLVTKVYSEAFSSYAMLRKVGGGDNDVRRLKVLKSADGITLPGFKFSQESELF
jgi:hypothetical protein